MISAVASTLDGDNTPMPVWFQIAFVGLILLIIAFVIWTFIPIRRRKKPPTERGIDGSNVEN